MTQAQNLDPVEDFMISKQSHILMAPIKAHDAFHYSGAEIEKGKTNLTRGIEKNRKNYNGHSNAK